MLLLKDTSAGWVCFIHLDTLWGPVVFMVRSAFFAVCGARESKNAKRSCVFIMKGLEASNTERRRSFETAGTDLMLRFAPALSD